MKLTLSLTLLTSITSAQLLLPVDQSIFTNFDDALELEVATPIKGDLVLTPQTAFETWAVFAYNSVVQRTDTNGLIEHRMYYDCIAGSGVPPGRRRRLDISHRYVCLATSVDGLNWVRPNLNIFAVNGSKANNILVEDSGVSVFYDPSATSDSERWKMICSNSAYASIDGLHWIKLPFVAVATDDTKPTAYYDPKTKKYAIVVRRDLDAPSNKSSDVVRYIGRCDTTNLSDWQESTPNGCPSIFGVDDLDPDHVDIYTNAWTPYPSIENAAAHFYFPSYYAHFSSGAPFGFGNDGLLDVRLLVSRDGYNLTYVPGARNARSPFVSLGVNKCGASTPSIKNGWCNPYNGVEQHTSADTSAICTWCSISLHLLNSISLFHVTYARTQTWQVDTFNRTTIRKSISTQVHNLLLTEEMQENICGVRIQEFALYVVVVHICTSLFTYLNAIVKHVKNRYA